MNPIVAVLSANGILLGVLAYLANEIRRDVRFTRDKVLILWDHHQRAIRHSDVHKDRDTDA